MVARPVKTTPTRTAAIGIRVLPEIKALAERVAVADSRTLASLVEKLLTDHLRERGVLPDVEILPAGKPKKVAK